MVSLLLAFTPFRVLWWTEGITWMELAYSLSFLLLFGCWAIRYFMDRAVRDKVQEVKSPISAPLILLFSAALVSAAIGISKERSFTAWASHANLIAFYGLYFVVVGYLRKPKDLYKIFFTFFSLCTFAVVRGVFYRTMVTPRYMLVMGSTVPKLVTAAGAGVILLMMLIPFVILSKQRIVRFFSMVAVFFLGLQQVLAFIRSRWIGIIAGVTFLVLVLTPRERARYLRYTAVVLFIVTVYVQICSMFPYENLFFRLPSIVEKRFVTILHPETEETAQTRFSEWRAAIEKIKKHPIVGNGLGTSVKYIRYDYQSRPTDISTYLHNSYLFFYLNTGLSGLIAIVWLTIAFAVYGIRVYKRTERDYDRALVLGCVTTFITMAATSLVGPELTWPARTIVAGFLLGAVAFIDKHKKAELR
jgi:O-antigen ligase